MVGRSTPAHLLHPSSVTLTALRKGHAWSPLGWAAASDSPARWQRGVALAVWPAARGRAWARQLQCVFSSDIRPVDGTRWRRDCGYGVCRRVLITHGPENIGARLSCRAAQRRGRRLWGQRLRRCGTAVCDGGGQLGVPRRRQRRFPSQQQT